MSKLLIKDISKYLPSQVVPGVMGFISIPIITRLFSPQEYGDYSLVLATVMVLTTILNWSVSGVIRFYPAYEKDEKLDVFEGSIVLSHIFVSVIILLACYLILYSLRHSLSGSLYYMLRIGIYLTFVTALFQLLQFFLRAKRIINWYSFFSSWKSGGGVGVGLLLILIFEKSIAGLLWGSLLVMAVAMPFLWKIAVGSFSFKRIEFDVGLVKNIAKYNIPLVISNLFAWILNLSDRYILQFFKGPTEVGIYSASYNITDRSIMLVNTLFILALSPIVMKTWENEGEEKCKLFITNLTRYYLLACIPLAFGFIALSKSIMAILTGQNYLLGYKIFPYVVIGVVCMGLQHIFQTGLLLHKKTLYITVAIVVSGIINIVLNIIFIPTYGFMAAAMTTLLSCVLLLFFVIVFSRKYIVWKFPLTTLLKTVLSALVMSFLVVTVGKSVTHHGINVIISVPLGVILYVIALFFLKEFNSDEVQTIKNSTLHFFKKNNK